jgi:membrane-associated phospholipid phosphatase
MTHIPHTPPPAAPPSTLREHGRLRTLHEKFVVEERYVRPEQRRRLYVSAVVLALTGGALFTWLLVSVLTGTGPAALDDEVATWFTQQRNESATIGMIALAIAFGPFVMPVVVLAVTVVWTLRARHAWRPLVLAGGMLVGVVTAQIVARLVQRERPPLSLMLFGGDTTFSFPSGHVLGASDFFLITAFLIVSRRGGPRAALVAFALAAFGIAAQIVSRLYLGYHWLTDTLASVSLSLVILGLVIAVDTWRTVRIPGEPIEGPLSIPQESDAAPDS